MAKETGKVKPNTTHDTMSELLPLAVFAVLFGILLFGIINHFKP